MRDYRPPSSRSGKLQSVLHAIDAASPRTGTRLDRTFEKFRAQTSRRGMVAVISDFYCDPDELLEWVRPLAWQGQDVLLFQLLDAAETAPEVTSNVLLEDLETGAAVEVSPQYMRDEYPKRLQAHVARLERAAAGAGADYMRIQTDDSLARALREYLRFRQRRT